MSPAPAIATSKDFILRFYRIRMAHSRERIAFQSRVIASFQSESCYASDELFCDLFFYSVLRNSRSYFFWSSFFARLRP
jgi:hypothetical protein